MQYGSPRQSCTSATRNDDNCHLNGYQPSTPSIPMPSQKSQMGTLQNNTLIAKPFTECNFACICRTLIVRITCNEKKLIAGRITLQPWRTKHDVKIWRYTLHSFTFLTHGYFPLTTPVNNIKKQNQILCIQPHSTFF